MSLVILVVILFLTSYLFKKVLTNSILKLLKQLYKGKELDNLTLILVLLLEILCSLEELEDFSKEMQHK